uniref:Uncharacterized protein n=1 Tax=Octopus bimaculoides TaxID=37653 RepID=A0A0L8I6T3_OCTBM
MCVCVCVCVCLCVCIHIFFYNAELYPNFSDSIRAPHGIAALSLLVKVGTYVYVSASMHVIIQKYACSAGCCYSCVKWHTISYVLSTMIQDFTIVIRQ